MFAVFRLTVVNHSLMFPNRILNNPKRLSNSLRVYSPSAEVQGHGPGQEVLQTGKREVGIDELQLVGRYGVQPHFSDGHDSGIFSWDYLYRLGRDQPALWQQYEQRLADAGLERDAPMSAALAAKSCGH